MSPYGSDQPKAAGRLPPSSGLETFRERVLIADQLGVKSWQRPAKVMAPDAMVRQIDSVARSAFARATTQRLQQVRQTICSLARGMTMGFMR